MIENLTTFEKKIIDDAVRHIASYAHEELRNRNETKYLADYFLFRLDEFEDNLNKKEIEKNLKKFKLKE